MRAYRWLLAFALAALLSAGSASAQARKDPKVGISLGGGATYLTVPKGMSRKRGPDYYGGLFAIVPLTRTYKLQPEVSYERQDSIALGERRRFEYLGGALLVRMSLFKGLFITEGPSYHMVYRASVAGADVKNNTQDNISITIGVGKRGAHAALEGRWDSYIKATQKRLVPGDVPTRPRVLTLLLSIF